MLLIFLGISQGQIRFTGFDAQSRRSWARGAAMTGAEEVARASAPRVRADPRQRACWRSK
jgi:erythromycin esterase-like protein